MRPKLWRKKITLIGLVWMFLIAGCGPAAPSPTATPAPAIAATQPVPLTGPESTNTPEPFLTRASSAQTAPAADTKQATQQGQDRTPQGSAKQASTPSGEYELQSYPVPAGSHPHDVAPAPDGTVWYTAQATGELGRLDPASGETHHIGLGSGSSPHGVIVGPDAAPWITDSGLNAIVRVDPETEEVQVFPLPGDFPGANLNTAAFDNEGVLWFTGQNGMYGRLNPAEGQVEAFIAPEGRGPYGIATTPDGEVYFVSLAGSYLAKIDRQTGQATVIEPPTPEQGARRVWADTQGRLWVSEWRGGKLGRYDPATEQWKEWDLPGDNPQPYAVYVDDQDIVWISDFGSNAMVRFDPEQETFQTIQLPRLSANVRQILGRPGEVWGAESGTDHLIVIRTR